MPPMRTVRPATKHQVPSRAALPAPQPLRLPTGYYDPDSVAFDERPLTDLEGLYRSTTPAKPARELRPVSG